MKHYFYIYYDPETLQPFLVGKGSKERAYDHLKEKLENTNNPHKFYKIQQILPLKPIIKIFPCSSEDEAYNTEEMLIKHFGRKGINKNGILTNIHPGGKGGTSGCIHSDESKNQRSQKISLIWDIIFPDGHTERIKNLTKFCKDKKLSVGNLRNTFKNINKRYKGYHCTLADLPENNKHRYKGTNKTQEYKQQMKLKMKEISNKPEVKLAKSNAMIGNKNSLGKKHKLPRSKETCEKLSLAAKLRLSNPENHPMFSKHRTKEFKQKLSVKLYERKYLLYL